MGENGVAMGYLNLSMEEPQNSHQVFMENMGGEAETESVLPTLVVGRYKELIMGAERTRAVLLL